MPTIPLMSDTTTPGASHDVAAPGGYELWHFDASSDDGRLHLVAELHQAWGSDPRYVRQYWAYRKFPTRFRPPMPAQFPAVTFALLEPGRAPIRFAATATREDVRIAPDGRSVRVGPSHAERSVDDALRLHVRGGEESRTIAADLTFHPIVRGGRAVVVLAGEHQADRAGAARTTSETRGSFGSDSTAVGDRDSEHGAGGEHRWAVLDALCEVEGEISIFQESGAPKVIAFAGVGYHDQRWGTRPAAEAGDVWLHGRVLLEDRAIAFAQVGAGMARLFIAGKDLPGEFSAARVEQTGGELRVGPVHLIRPTVLHSNWAETITSYEATVAGEHGVALCRRERSGRQMNPIWGWWGR